MKTIVLASTAAMLAAGTAFADQVQVVIPLTADAQVIVEHVEFIPGTMPFATLDGDFQGFSSADVVNVDANFDADGNLDFGFEPDAIIYIYKNDDGTFRMVQQPN